MRDGFVPLINEGIYAGDNPRCFDGGVFNTEEECRQWIDKMKEEGKFDAEELAGKIVPFWLDPYVEEEGFEDEDY